MALTRSEMDRRIDEHFAFEGSRQRRRRAGDAIAGGGTRCRRLADGADARPSRGEAPGRPFGLEGRGRPLEFRLLHVIEFTGAGDIRRENVWVDMAAVMQQLPQD